MTAKTDAQLTGKVDLDNLKPDNNAVVDGRTGNEDEKKKSKFKSTYVCTHAHMCIQKPLNGSNDTR